MQTHGKQDNKYVGLIYCGDCGANMVRRYYYSEKNGVFEDYDKYARACYKQAMHFSFLCIRNQDLIVSEHCMAWYTNVAFSCELFFKYYLFCIHADSKTFIKKHDLFELFTLLQEELQKDIIKCHPEKDITRDMFELNLKELGKAFTEFRYSYEKDSMAFNAQFLAELFAELYERTEPLKE